jgi:hypothetical protein
VLKIRCGSSRSSMSTAVRKPVSAAMPCVTDAGIRPPSPPRSATRPRRCRPSPSPIHAHAGVVANVVRVDPLLELPVAVARRGRRGAPPVRPLLSEYETSAFDDSPPARN